MAGIQNRIIFGEGFKLQASTAASISNMQETATDVSNINFTGNPNGSVAANPSSLCHDPVSGAVYYKGSGTGNTGWIQIISNTGDVVGPASATDNAVARYDGTTGKLIKNSLLTVDNNGNTIASNNYVGNILNFGPVNTDTTNTGSHALLSASTAGGGGNPTIGATVSATRFFAEWIDQADSNAWKLNTAANSAFTGGTTVRRMSVAGQQTLPLQPAFAAYLAATAANVTGDGTTYTIAFDSEFFDQGTNFGSNVFTAPITGIYRFDYTLSLSGMGAAHVSCLLQIIIGGAQIQVEAFNPFLANNAAQSECNVSGSVLVQMTASNTADMRVTVTGGTKTVSVVGTSIATRFSGNLVC